MPVLWICEVAYFIKKTQDAILILFVFICFLYILFIAIPVPPSINRHIPIKQRKARIIPIIATINGRKIKKPTKITLFIDFCKFRLR